MTTATCAACGATYHRWRQCGVCKKDICYCPACGDDKRAVTEMVEHIRQHEEKDSNPCPTTSPSTTA